MDSQGIWIIEHEINSVEDSKSSIDTGATYNRNYQNSIFKKNFIDSENLKKNINNFQKVIEYIFDRNTQNKSKFSLDEVELMIEINSEGQVCLLGSGGKVGTKGGIKLKFKRINDEKLSDRSRN